MVQSKSQQSHQPAPQDQHQRSVRVFHLRALPAQVTARVFGSVAINAYLPDGDIDFSLLGGPSRGSEDKHPLKEVWTQQLAGVLNREQRDPHAELRVGQVTVVNAEVCPHTCTEGPTFQNPTRGVAILEFLLPC